MPQPSSLLPIVTHRVVVLASCVLVIVFFFYTHTWSIPQPSSPSLPYKAPPASLPQGLPLPQTPSLPQIPEDYLSRPDDDDWCERAYGHSYIRSLRDEHVSLCEDGTSMSGVECFTTHLKEDRPETFCVAKSVLLRPGEKPFKLDCTVKNSEKKTQPGKEDQSPNLFDLPKHMFDTGLGNIVDRFFHVSNTTNPLDADTKAAMELCAAESDKAEDYKVLVLRDPSHGAHHWHSMWEIVAMHWTVDALRITPRSSDGNPYFTNKSAEESQIVLLDDDDKGPFFDMWKYFAPRPEVRVHDIKEPTCLHNVLLPLPGGANPLWYGDWRPKNCGVSPNLDVYIKRLMSHFGMKDRRKPDAPITVTVIERHRSRTLKDSESLVEALRKAFPTIEVQTIDWQEHDFKKQLQIAAETDVLVGVHGAGLTMQMYMPSRSAVVEILPYNFHYRGFRNLANLVGHKYFSVHTKKGEWAEKEHGWQRVNEVELEQEKWLDTVGAAVHSVFNARERADDIV